MNTPKQKAFIYLRRSQDRHDRQVLSIEGQRKQLKKIIKEHNLAPIWMPAESASAHKTGRPIFNQMIERIKAGEARIIVTWTPNRLSRNAKDAGEIVHLLQEGLLLKVITDNKVYSTANPEDQFFLGLELGMAKKNSDDTSRSVKRGNLAKYERGEYPGNAFIGYTNVANGYYKNIAPDPERAPLVVACFEMASTGQYTLNELFVEARDNLRLTSRKGKQLKKSTFQEMLQRLAYTGNFEYAGEVREGSYQPLISKELYNKVQHAMGWKRGSKRTRNSTSGLFYPFKRILRCETCGHNITAYTKPKVLKRTGELKNYVFYTCTKKSKSIMCKEPQISESDLEIQLTQQLSLISINESEAQECFQLIKSYHKEMVNNRNTMREVWMKDNREARSKLDKLLDMRLSGELTEAEFMRHKQEDSELEARTNELLNDSTQDANAWLELAEEFFSGTVNIVDTFELATDDEKDRMLQAIGSNWTLGNKKVRLTPRKPYDLLLNRTNSSNWRTRPDSNRRSPP